MQSTRQAPLTPPYSPEALRVVSHVGTYKDRKITVVTYKCDDGKYCIEGVTVDVRKGESLAVAVMPYLGIVDADEQKVVRQAMADASVYAQVRY